MLLWGVAKNYIMYWGVTSIIIHRILKKSAQTFIFFIVFFCAFSLETCPKKSLFCLFLCILHKFASCVTTFFTTLYRFNPVVSNPSVPDINGSSSKSASNSARLIRSFSNKAAAHLCRTDICASLICFASR